jgi:hypothetical protein
MVAIGLSAKLTQCLSPDGQITRAARDCGASVIYHPRTVPGVGMRTTSHASPFAGMASLRAGDYGAYVGGEVSDSDGVQRLR